MRIWLVAAVRALAVLVVVASGALPLWLILKQAVTPDRESFAWPPTWTPHELTVENFRALATTSEAAGAAALSATVAVVVTALTLALALPAARVAARRRRADHGLETLVTVARVFPPVALAIPLAVVLVRLGLYNRPSGVALWLAHAGLALPAAFLVLRAGFAAVPRDLEDAARIDGASPLRAFVHVTLGFPGLASAVAVVMLVPALVIVLFLEPAFRSGLFAGGYR
jgi:multiple sugar transport system permease protein